MRPGRGFKGDLVSRSIAATGRGHRPPSAFRRESGRRSNQFADTRRLDPSQPLHLRQRPFISRDDALNRAELKKQPLGEGWSNPGQSLEHVELFRSDPFWLSIVPSQDKCSRRRGLVRQEANEAERVFRIARVEDRSEC